MLKVGKHMYHLEYDGRWLYVDADGQPEIAEEKSNAGRFKVIFDPKTFLMKMWHIKEQGGQAVALRERKLERKFVELVFDGQWPADADTLELMQKEGLDGFILRSTKRTNLVFCGEEVDFFFHQIE